MLGVSLEQNSILGDTVVQADEKKWMHLWWGRLKMKHFVQWGKVDDIRDKVGGTKDKLDGLV